MSVTGTARPLSAAVDLTAYRILQEALTNVIRHAGPATAQISLDYSARELRLHVIDTGNGPPAPAATATTTTLTGHGLIGMAERAAALAGSVQTGQEPTGGFGVHARLPIDPPAPVADNP